MKKNITLSELKECIENSIKRILRESEYEHVDAFDALQNLCDEYCSDVKFEAERNLEDESDGNYYESELFSYAKWYTLLYQVDYLIYLINCRDYFESMDYGRFSEIEMARENGEVDENDERNIELEKIYDEWRRHDDESVLNDYLLNREKWVNMPSKEKVVNLVNSLNTTLEADVEEAKRHLDYWQNNFSGWMNKIIQ